MRLEDIRRVLVVGAGTMGQQTGLQCAMYGYDVVLHDVAQDRLDAAQAQQQAMLDGLVSAGHLTQEQAQAVLARITATVDPVEAAREVDLVSESVPENPELKARVFAQLNALCPPRAIFTTNTSTLIPSMLAEWTGRPAQFAALHFHPPVWYCNVVDVMAHPGTDPQVVELLVGFARRIGQTPIVSQKENHGYVFNTMLNALTGAALTLAAKGVVPVEDVDRAWMGIMKTAIGPFGILDGVGLDTVWDIAEYWAKVTGDPQTQKNADFVKGYLDKGWLGVKSGRGFYSYPNPAYSRPGFVAGE